MHVYLRSFLPDLSLTLLLFDHSVYSTLIFTMLSYTCFVILLSSILSKCPNHLNISFYLLLLNLSLYTIAIIPLISTFDGCRHPLLLVHCLAYPVLRCKTTAFLGVRYSYQIFIFLPKWSSISLAHSYIFEDINRQILLTTCLSLYDSQK